MPGHIVKINSIRFVTHDVVRIQTEKPDGFTFQPGQATEVSINRPEWNNEGRPFTFTSIPSDPLLEFTIKTYPERHGVTEKLRLLQPKDELILTDIFGDIRYRGEGIFIAGGAGITPFLSIFKFLDQHQQIGNNMLMFANKKKEDIIYEEYLRKKFGDRFISFLSGENVPGNEHGFITEDMLKKHVSDFSRRFYICGPPPMMEAVVNYLLELGVKAEQIVFDAF